MSFACHLHVNCMRSCFIYKHSYIIRMSVVCTRISSVCYSCVIGCHPYFTRMYLYVIRMYSYVIRMSLACTRMSSVCHSYVLVYHPYVIRMYSYIIWMPLVCTRMSSVCHWYVLVCHSYVPRMYSYVIRIVTRMWFYHEPGERWESRRFILVFYCIFFGKRSSLMFHPSYQNGGKILSIVKPPVGRGWLRNKLKSNQHSFNVSKKIKMIGQN